MKRAFINGNIYKKESAAILIENENIIYIGSNQEVMAMTDSHDEIIDLKGMFVLPGFIDSHMHLLELGHYLDNVQLSSCRSLDDVRNRIETKLKTIRDGQWIIGRGYNEDAFDIPARPDRRFLDEISRDVPIALTRACGHILSANSKALAEAGITADTVVEGGVIDYEKGILEESAIHLIHDAQPSPDIMQLEDYILAGAEYAGRFGITTVGSDDFLSVTEDYESVLDAMEKLSFQKRLHVRINEQCEFPDVKAFAHFLDDGYTFDVGNDLFRIGPLKLILDGSLGGRTAALSDSYADDPSLTGYMSMTDEEIETYVSLAGKFNMPVICHAIGDEAVDRILDIFDTYVYEGNPLHHGLVHCQILRNDQIQRIIQKSLSCYYQTIFIDYDASIVEKRVGKNRAKTSYPYKTLYKGTLCSNGSDAPVEMPNALLGIQLAVTRKSVKYPEYSMDSDECMSIEEAIDSYTINGARQMFMDDRIGRLEPGYYADMVVLDKDLTKIQPEEIAAAKVMMTVMNGKTVYER